MSSHQAATHSAGTQSSRQVPVTVIGQPIDTFNRIRPKIPIGPRGQLAHVFPTYIGFEGSHHAVPNHR